MIELLAITAAVADLLDENHAEEPDPDFPEVTRTLRPETPVDALGTGIRVSVSPRRSVLTLSSRGTVDVNPLAVQVLLEQRLGEGRDPEDADENDFAAAVTFAGVVKSVEDTLWGARQLEHDELEVEASLLSVEEGPDDDENISALSLDEHRVLRAVLIANYIARREI
jgi:hypothetical protein